MNAEDAEDLDNIYLNAKSAEKKEQLAAARARLVASSSPPPGALVQEQPSRFRQTLLRVMIVQVISLAVLWWLQARYGR